jgi:hypothetical protein
VTQAKTWLPLNCPAPCADSEQEGLIGTYRARDFANRRNPLDREYSALEVAQAVVNKYEPALVAVRQASERLTHSESDLLTCALQLQIAATQVGLPSTATAAQCKAFGGLAALQRELLLGGWDNLLRARYAAAMQPARVLDELSAFIVAAAVEDEQAAIVLSTPDSKWNIKNATEAIRRHAEQRNKLKEYERWQAGRAVHRQQLHPLAHTGGMLMTLALRVRDGAVEVPMGPDLSSEQVGRIALYYMLLVHEMVLAMGCACEDQLDPAGAWRLQQTEFLEQFDEYCGRTYIGT